MTILKYIGIALVVLYVLYRIFRRRPQQLVLLEKVPRIKVGPIMVDKPKMKMKVGR